MASGSREVGFLGAGEVEGIENVVVRSRTWQGKLVMRVAINRQRFVFVDSAAEAVWEA